MKIEMTKMNLGFKHLVKHTQASRKQSDTILFTAKNGLFTGYGEAVPRKYVSGEDGNSVDSFLQNLLVDKISNLDSLKEFIDTHQNLIDANPAAWCGVELAILDLLSQEMGLSFEEFLGLPPIDDNYQFSAVVPAMSSKVLAITLEQYLNLGFKDFKFKITGQESEGAFQLIRELSYRSGIRVRLDANNLWDRPEDVIAALNTMSINWYAIEEPLKFLQNQRYWQDINDLVNTIQPYIILDDSFRKIDDLQHIQDHDKFIYNLRISKMGGILRTLDLLKKITGSKIIIGCHVGESSLLTRVALSLSSTLFETIVAREGAFSTHLLTNDPFEPNLKFAARGLLNTEGLLFDKRLGLGVHYLK